MIKEILEQLSDAKGETEAIKIAKGKYKLSTTFKDAINEIKREVKWRSR